VEALRPRPNKRAKIQEKWNEVKRVAKNLWNKDPSKTIEEIAISDEVTTILGRNYEVKTIRKQIKDICPNRTPGRRPTKK
jgi:hypothetical protein